jgi:hypothetical protein
MSKSYEAMHKNYLESVIKKFEYYKMLGEKNLCSDT